MYACFKDCSPKANTLALSISVSVCGETLASQRPLPRHLVASASTAAWIAPKPECGESYTGVRICINRSMGTYQLRFWNIREDTGAKRHQQVHLVDERERVLIRLVFEEDDDCRAVAGEEIQSL
jgi:hypothetical protein